MALTETIKSGVVSTTNRDTTFIQPAWLPGIKKAAMRASPFFGMSGTAGSTHNMTYNWTEQPLMDNSVSILDVYLDAGLSSAYVSGGVANDVVYLSMTAANARKLAVGDNLSIFTSTTKSIRGGNVTSVNVVDDTTSYAAVRLLNADTSNRLAEATPSALISNAHPEKRSLPQAKYSELVQRTNYLQIIANSISDTDIQRIQQEYVSPEQWQRATEQMIAKHKQAITIALLTGIGQVYSSGTLGPQYHTWGLMPWMDTYQSENVFNFTTDTTTEFAGATWENKGVDYMLYVGENIGRTAEAERKTAVTSSTAMYHIQKSMSANGQYTFESGTNEWGYKVKTLHNMAGPSWDFIEDPTFSQHTELQTTMVVYEPQLISRMKLKDIGGQRFIEEETNSHSWRLHGVESIVGGVYKGLDKIAIIKNIGTTNEN
jgi:hypothetical protein